MIPNFDDRRQYWVYVFGRLKPGVSLEQASAAIAPTYRAILNDVEVPLQTEITDQTRAQFRTKTLVLEPGARGQSSVRELARAPLTLLLGATAIVLLIACVNIANLMLARGTGRARRDGGARLARRAAAAAARAAVDRGAAARGTRGAREPAGGARHAARHRYDRAGRHRQLRGAALERCRRSARVRNRGGLRARLRRVPGAQARPHRPGSLAARERHTLDRRQGRRPVPADADDRANRAVDDAARARDAVRAEPRKHLACRLGHADGVARHVQRLSGAQRLFAGANHGAVRPPREGARRAARRGGRRVVDGAAVVVLELEQRRQRRRLRAQSRRARRRGLQLGRHGLCADARDLAARRPRLHGLRHRGSAESRDRESRVRAPLRAGRRRRRQARRNPRRPGRRSARHRDRRFSRRLRVFATSRRILARRSWCPAGRAGRSAS